MAGPPQPRPRVPYPVLDTSTTARAGANGISADPGGRPDSGFDQSRFPSESSPFAPSPSEAKESQRLNKRLANSPKSGPIDKRPRMNGSSDASRSAGMDATTKSRQSSLTSGPLHRPSAFEQKVGSSRAPRLQTSVQGPAGSASPLQTFASPLSTAEDVNPYGSESSTPVHVAPTAPSMFPVKRPATNEPRRGVASIRSAAAKKQAIPKLIAASENTALAQLRAKNIELGNELKNEKKRGDQLEERMKVLSNKLKQLEETLPRQHPLTDDIFDTLKNRILESIRSDAKGMVAIELESLDTRVRDVKQTQDLGILKSNDLSQQFSALQQRIEGLRSAQEKWDASEKSKQSKAVQPDVLDKQLTNLKAHLQHQFTTDLDAKANELLLNANNRYSALGKDIIKDIVNKHIKPLKQELKNDMAVISKTLREEFEKTKTAHSTKLEELQTQITNLGSITIDVQKLQSTATTVEELRTELQSTATTVEELRTQLVKFQTVHSDQTPTGVLSHKLQGLQDRIQGLQNRVEDVEETLKDTEKTALGAEAQLNTMSANLISDFSTKSREQLAPINESIRTLRNDLNELRDQATVSQNAGSAQMDVSTVDGLQGDITVLRDETTTKHSSLEEKLATLQLSIQQLQDRYNNVTTDFLHQQMVHWIAENYPAAPEFLIRLQQIDQVTTGLNKLGQFINKIAYVELYKDQLKDLAQNSDKVFQLLRDIDQLGHPETWENFDAIRNMIAAERETRCKDIGEIKIAFDTAIGTERNKRELLAQGIKPVQQGFSTSIDKLNRALTEGFDEVKTSTQELSTRVTAVETTIGEHGDILERQRNTTGNIKPLVQQMAISVSELQETVKNVNEGLKKPFPSIKFTHDFRRPPTPHS